MYYKLQGRILIYRGSRIEDHVLLLSLSLSLLILFHHDASSNDPSEPLSNVLHEHEEPIKGKIKASGFSSDEGGLPLSIQSRRQLIDFEN